MGCLRKRRDMKIDAVYWVRRLMRLRGLGCTGIVRFKLGWGWKGSSKLKMYLKKPYRNLILYFSVLVIF